MQFDALFIEPETALPKANAASAIAPPDDGEDQRIFGSRSTGLVLQHANEGLHFVISFHKHPCPPVDTDFMLRVDRRNYAELTRPRTRWNRVKRSVAVAPERSAAEGLRLR